MKKSIDWFLYDTCFYWKVFSNRLWHKFSLKKCLFLKNKVILIPWKYRAVWHYLLGKIVPSEKPFIRLSLMTSCLILPYQGGTKYLTHYSFLAIILFRWVYVGLYFPPILLNTKFLSFLTFYVFCFESNVFNQDLKRMLSLINRVLVAL